MRKNLYKTLAGISLCACIMALTACGGTGDAAADDPEQEQTVTVTEKETPEDAEETEEASVEVQERELSAEEAEALQAAQIRHYYSGVLSELTAAWRLPDMEVDTSSLEGGFGEMRDNSFAVTDIDGDGREELIISYANASMAGVFEVIYDYDPKTEQLRQEFLQFPSIAYFDNGVISAQASHNHSRGMDFWPIDLYRYQAEQDAYEWIGYVDTWGRSWSEFFDADESKPFPEELDVDGDGILYNIQTGSPDAISYDYEEYCHNKADYEEWYQEIMAGADEIQIDREPLEYVSFADFTAHYLSMLADYANIGRTDTETDLGLLILKNEEEYFLDASKKLLTESYEVVIEQPYPDGEEYTVGVVDGKEIFSFTELNAGYLGYEKEKVGDVTIFGIYPGLSVDAAWKKLKAYGFYASPYGEVENCLITGEGFGNICVTFLEENGRVTTISAGPFCAFAG